jgi:hypothetical protein
MFFQVYFCRIRLDYLTYIICITFKNPFYCGLISHNFLEGELVQGKHEALINEALF